MMEMLAICCPVSVDKGRKQRHVEKWFAWILLVAVMANQTDADEGQARIPSFDGSNYTWEAEAACVGKHASGATWRVAEDDAASGGAWILFYGEEPGDFIEFTLPDVLPGQYTVRLRYKAHAERGICQVSLGEADGSGQVALGKPIDMNRDEGFHEASVGPCLVELMGFRTVRLTIIGTSGEQFKLGIDSVLLLKASQRILDPPIGLKASHIAPDHCVLQWNASEEEVNGYLIQRRGGKTDDWRVVGSVPGNATRFVAAGLCDNAEYEFRIASYDGDARSDYSLVTSLTTSTADHSMRGRVLSASPGRIGGATMMVRADGSILMLAHYQEQLQDQGSFEIHEMVSRDHGNTWTERKTLLAAPDKTYMMPALLRLANGDALFCYTERDLALTWGKRWCQRSTDGGMTWSEPILATADLPLQRDEFSLNMPTGPHDRLVQTSSGRVLFPIHFPWIPGANHTAHSAPRVICSVVYYSDNNGQTWQRACEPMLIRGMTPASAKHRDLQGLWEPSIVETQPEKLLMYLRSNTGWYYESRSDDDGTTWSAPRQSPARAPLCPAKLVKLPDERIGIILNSIFDYTHANLGRRWDLGTMISDDSGKTWTNYKSVEFRDPQETRFGLYYCYPTVLFDGDRLHMSYYGPVNGRQFNLIYQQLPATWFTD